MEIGRNWVMEASFLSLCSIGNQIAVVVLLSLKLSIQLRPIVELCLLANVVGPILKKLIDDVMYHVVGVSEHAIRSNKFYNSSIFYFLSNFKLETPQDRIDSLKKWSLIV